MRARLPGSAGVGGWFALLGVSILLGGWVGVVGSVIVAVVVLAERPRRLIGLVGVAALACVPLFVLLSGLPARSAVSPAFVSSSLWPHRLAFIGLLLGCTWAVLDLAPHLRRGGDPAASPAEPLEEAQPPPAVAWAVVTLVAVAAVTASWAVLQG